MSWILLIPFCVLGAVGYLTWLERRESGTGNSTADSCADSTDDDLSDDHEDFVQSDMPSFNIDGTPMIGMLDINGNPYGITSSTSMFDDD